MAQRALELPVVDLSNTAGGKYSRVICYLNRDLISVTPVDSEFVLIHLDDVIHGLDLTNHGLGREMVQMCGYTVPRLYATFDGGVSFNPVYLFVRIGKEITEKEGQEITDYMNAKLSRVPFIREHGSNF